MRMMSLARAIVRFAIESMNVIIITFRYCGVWQS